MTSRTFGLLAAAVGLALTGGVRTAAAAAADTSPILTIQIDNDSTRPHSDRYYTSGERLGYTSAPDQLPGFLASLGHGLLGPGSQRMAIDLRQLIFTPDNTQIRNPGPRQRPYAGLLVGSLTLIQDTANTRTALGLGLGVIGPAALGRQVQNGFHDIIGDTQALGWGTQIPNQPVIQLTAERIWRVSGPQLGPLETDVLPAVSVGAGTWQIYGEAGAQVRIGQNLHTDFGAPSIPLGVSGTDAYGGANFAWYVFLGANGRLVGWDETLDGLPFGASRHVDRVPYVGQLQGGIAMMLYGFRISASQTLETTEFRGQRAGMFQYSSLSISAKF